MSANSSPFRGKPVSASAVFAPGEAAPGFESHNLLDDRDLRHLQDASGYRIVNPGYFEQALVHRSFLQIAEPEGIVSNERLEFLGDSILYMLIGEFLSHHYTDIQEGDLTKLRSRLVNRKAMTLLPAP